MIAIGLAAFSFVGNVINSPQQSGDLFIVVGMKTITTLEEGQLYRKTLDSLKDKAHDEFVIKKYPGYSIVIDLKGSGLDYLKKVGDLAERLSLGLDQEGHLKSPADMQSVLVQICHSSLQGFDITHLSEIKVEPFQEVSASLENGQRVNAFRSNGVESPNTGWINVESQWKSPPSKNLFPALSVTLNVVGNGSAQDIKLAQQEAINFYWETLDGLRVKYNQAMEGVARSLVTSGDFFETSSLDRNKPLADFDHKKQAYIKNMLLMNSVAEEDIAGAKVLRTTNWIRFKANARLRDGTIMPIKCAIPFKT
jgi:hypothetical protein